MHKKTLLVAILIVVALLGSGLVYYSILQNNPLINNNNVQSIKMIDVQIHSDNISLFQMGSHDLVTVHAPEPETPLMLPVYRATLREGDYIDKSFGPVFKKRTNVVSQEDAPEAAEKALEPYGGLPSDAVLGGAVTNYAFTLNRTTWKEENGIPMYTDVFYHRQIDGMPVIGFSDKIQVTLGTDGEVLEILKIWRTLEKTGTMKIIPARSATEKLNKGEVIDRPLNVSNVSIDKIKLYYYESSRKDKEVYIEPVWSFQGKTSTDSPEEFLVYARQFAGFSQTPATTKKLVAGKSVEEKDSFTATFTDMSDANPKKWQWDFGDGTTSTEKNPTHKYKTAGTYNVTLTVWNDLGSDTMTQQYIVEDVAGKMEVGKESVTVSETTNNGNETAAIVTDTPTATVLVTVNQTVFPTTPIPANATTITTVPTGTTTASPTESPNVTPSTTTGNTTAT